MKIKQPLILCSLILIFTTPGLANLQVRQNDITFHLTDKRTNPFLMPVGEGQYALTSSGGGTQSIWGLEFNNMAGKETIQFLVDPTATSGQDRFKVNIPCEQNASGCVKVGTVTLADPGKRCYTNWKGDKFCYSASVVQNGKDVQVIVVPEAP